jgi:hypothetical protein
MPRNAHLLPANRESESFIDHVWLPPVGGVIHRVVALCDFNDPHAAVNAAAGTQQNIGSVGFGGSTDHVGSQSSSYFVSLSRRQHVFILEGQDVANQSSLTSAPINLEFRQYISVKINDTPSQQHQQAHGTRRASELVAVPSGATTPSQHSHSQSLHTQSDNNLTNPNANMMMFDIPRIECLLPTSKGFILMGGSGFLAMYERAVDKRENFVETRRLCLGDMCIIGATLIQNEEKIVCVARNNRIITFGLIADDNSTSNNNSGVMDVAVQALLNRSGTNKEAEPTNAMNSDGDSVNDNVVLPNGQSTTDLVPGGFYLHTVTALDTAREKPLVCTVSSVDKSLRMWNYETFECKILHYFRTDEPMAVTVHPSGFQVASMRHT